MFHPRISYSKLNKKNIDALCRSDALACLMDSRFTGDKHFWSAVAVDRPRKLNDLEDNIKKYAGEGEFSQSEKILNLVELTGVYPISMIVSQTVQARLEEKFIPPIAEYDHEIGICWFIVKDIEKKKSKSGNFYLIVDAIDDTNTVTRIKCWKYDDKRDAIHLHKPYIARLDYQDDWGFSTRSINKTFKLIG